MVRLLSLHFIKPRLLLFVILLSAGLYGCTAYNSAMNEIRESSVSYGHDPVMTGAYLDACGDCHFAYPPQLLPQPSWQQIMANLDNHFDDNAELESNDWQVINQYLANMGDNEGPLYRISNDGKAPIRITELRYFTQEHHGFPRRWVEDNPEVMSLGNCNSCHITNSRGEMFDEHSVSIPGIKF